MAAVQLSFKMRTSSGVKTVHLLGSWDGYTGQLPLAKDKSSKSGSWKGTFRFQGATLEPGQRYWYYYIIDGYHVTHDPAESNVVEPTTGRKLNILDVPANSSGSSSSRSKSSKHSSSKLSNSRDKPSSSHDKHSSSSTRRESRRDTLNLSVDVPKGRPLSSSQIKSPKPVSPGAANFILARDYESQTIEELTQRFANTAFEEDYDLSSSPPSSVGSSISSRSGSSSALSSASSMSDYSSGSSSPMQCTCERYGVTRKGDRIRLDCGGTRCGYIDDASSCCSDSSGDFTKRSDRRRDVRTH